MRWNSIEESSPDRKALGLTGDHVRLHANESPFPLPDVVLRAINKELSAHANHYPDPNATLLKRAIAAHSGIDPEQIVIGSGSGDIIEHVIRGLSVAPNDLIIPSPSFPLYQAIARGVSAKIQQVSLRLDGCIDLDAILRAMTAHTSLIIVCNPNNPTGGYLPLDDIAAFMDQVPESTAVLLDEAYWELTEAFASQSPGAQSLLARYPHLLITRTFSKYYGMAGLRIGYLMASGAEAASAVQKRMSRAMPNRLALIGAEASLSPAADAVYQEYGRIIRRERHRMAEAFRSMALDVYPSQTNFISVAWKDHQQRLPAAHIAIRAGETMALPKFSRITIATPEHNEHVLQIIRESLTPVDTPASV